MKIKHSFLLLEVLLAIALVALFAAPLMRYPIRQYQAQIDRLEEFERQRIADWTFTEIKELLLSEKIAWNKLPPKGQRISLFLPDAKMQLEPLPSRTLSRSYTLHCKGEKQGLHGEIFRLYKVEILLGKKKIYRYRVLVQKLPEEPLSRA
jgi:hypothetical protein